MCFVPGKLQQAEDRIHRIGQRESQVTVQYLVANNSYDLELWDLLEKKLGVIGKVLDGEAGVLSHSEKTKDLDIDDAVDDDFVNGFLDVVRSYDRRVELEQEEQARLNPAHDGRAVPEAPPAKRLVIDDDLDVGADMTLDLGSAKGKIQSLRFFKK